MKAQYFRRFQRARPEPVTIISNTDNDGSNIPFSTAIFSYRVSIYMRMSMGATLDFKESMSASAIYENFNASYTGF